MTCLFIHIHEWWPSDKIEEADWHNTRSLHLLANEGVASSHHHCLAGPETRARWQWNLRGKRSRPIIFCWVTMVLCCADAAAAVMRESSFPSSKEEEKEEEKNLLSRPNKSPFPFFFFSFFKNSFKKYVLRKNLIEERERPGVPWVDILFRLSASKMEESATMLC